MTYVCISETRDDRGKLVPFLESAGQIYPETGLIFEAPKCVLASVIIVEPPGVPPTNSGLLFMPLKIKQVVRNSKSLS
jgi:hypothetical protein